MPENIAGIFINMKQHLFSLLFSAELWTAFAYQSHSANAHLRMWDQCKTTIIKRKLKA